MNIQLPAEVESSILAAVHGGLFPSMDAAMTEAARLLLERVDRQRVDPPASHEPPASAGKPIWEQILERTADIPEEVWDRVPTDLAQQHDHYLYGTPKRPRHEKVVNADGSVARTEVMTNPQGTAASTDAAILARVLRPDRDDLSDEAARALLGLHFDGRDLDRLTRIGGQEPRRRPHPGRAFRAGGLPPRQLISQPDASQGPAAP